MYTYDDVTNSSTKYRNTNNLGTQHQPRRDSTGNVTGKKEAEETKSHMGRRHQGVGGGREEEGNTKV